MIRIHFEIYKDKSQKFHLMRCLSCIASLMRSALNVLRGQSRGRGSSSLDETELGKLLFSHLFSACSSICTARIRTRRLSNAGN
ncbi:hypothetical protein FGO68_gene5656 [Halteria grandinella]|uniref:Uncharacterized protein n=1 Tax=Halteria grandinella TaxID=5974 RepID=A0A8J8NWS2_HALGN|nr:hypothetical protein FGO68_gene5656 [Halteria grandinella]